MPWLAVGAVYVAVGLRQPDFLGVGLALLAWALVQQGGRGRR